MVKKSFPSVKIAGEQRILNARKDTTDIRDRMYEPALIQLLPEIDYRGGTDILDQGKEGACTGFGLAAVINLLNVKKRNLQFIASPRMLYEMAKKHDEWPGEDYAGSSCRGAIRGWKNMGVCSEGDWGYLPENPGDLTVERAKAARSCTVGAYYRLRPEITDYHAALNEVGAIYVSATVHSGWFSPRAASKNTLAIIKPSTTPEGGHAFAIVGYNSQGFIVQNSWGARWGTKGYALWLYQDWLQNISDGWVFQLAIPTPDVFGLSSRSQVTFDAESVKSAPKRLEIAGHFVHFDDGNFKKRGEYWSAPDDVVKTADLIKESADSKRYDHLLIYAHGGLNDPGASAKRIRALKEGFKRNGIYPFHIMYDTGLVEELKDSVLRAFSGKRTEGFFSDWRDQLIEQRDMLIEDFVRKPVTPIWEEMKNDAHRPFESKSNGEIGDGLFVLKTFTEALQDTHLKIHLAGHSTGAVLLGHLLDALDGLGVPDLIESCSLMAPACSMDFYKTHYEPRLKKQENGDPRVRLPVLSVYNLTEKLEQDDNVAFVYRKSLLCLVSRALERQTDKPILGMKRYSKKLIPYPGLSINYSKGGKKGLTTSTSHGGFDNDINTMNAIMAAILKKSPQKPFTRDEMKGY
ncbi:putative cysteine protease [Desulforapulum autotrophicum HRM2]|uniref:Cysteine protease n=1 Tax=Desulforapulum autotrophicum (strain ATCC 43914 / DSM 3382 / VKM B-1955 / HRM2) TaxID=177437 RepID=C0QL85_DESAH|nr:C1 family peptidase [Desulforapulum autotrophicum]ACN14171.1 putative cysteine protease [Desulforapulum autotrophicum HRM2]